MANQNSKNKSNNNTKKNNQKGKTSKETAVKQNNKKDTAKVTEVKKEKKVVEKTISVEEKTEELTSSVASNTASSTKKGLTQKQKDLILVLIAVIVLVIGLFATMEKKPKLDIELPVAVEGEAGFQEITYEEYENKISEKKPFLVIIIQDGCGYCESYIPVVKEVVDEYKFPVYYLNLTNLNSEESEALSSSNSYLKREKWGTPTTLFLYGDTVVDSIGGYVEKEAFVDFIKENIKVDPNV